MNLDSFIASSKKRIDQRLLDLISCQNEAGQTLFNAAKYSIEGAGKRLRPLLLLATCQDFGKDIELAVDPACSIELVHSYSLIHDDLPCMDDDDYRRGRPSLHKQFPEAIAILTGDYFLTLAFEVISNAKNLSDLQKLKLVQTLSKRAGAFGMIGGQIIDMESSDNLSIDRLKHMHEMKTGALIQCCVEFGAIICSLDEITTKNLSLSAKNIGYAFQVIDDILDVTKNSKDLGKPALSDEKNKKITSVNLLGLEEAKKLAEKLTAKALDHLPKEANLLKKLSKNLLKRSF